MNKTNRMALTIITALAGVLLSSAAMAENANVESKAIGFSVIKTANSSLIPEAVVVDSGSWFTLRRLAQNAVLIKHPKGNVLIDTGLGKNIEQQFESNSFFDRQLFKFDALDPVYDQLLRNNEDPVTVSKIIPTHLHWDHASGIEDFKQAQVWVQKEELEEAKSGQAPAHLQSQIDDPNILWNIFSLNNVSYKGFSRSLDLYKDGSIVLVDLSGHSAAQVGIFLTVSSGEQYFFIGDTTWTTKGIEDNSPRSNLIKWLVQLNWSDDKNTQQIDKLHQFQKNNRSITVVPAHDELIMASLPMYPDIKY
jgi:N-acyl homoserine lactone hydrolase